MCILLGSAYNQRCVPCTGRSTGSHHARPRMDEACRRSPAAQWARPNPPATWQTRPAAAQAGTSDALGRGSDAAGSAAEEAQDAAPPKGWLVRARDQVFGGPLDKAKLQSLGLGAIIAYGFVSNVTYGTVVTIGWATHVAATGVTPFAEGQLPAFLTRIAGLLALQHLLRPIRFSCAVALTPLVDRLMVFVQRRFNASKRLAFVVLFFALAVVTLAAFAVALTTATVWNLPAK